MGLGYSHLSLDLSFQSNSLIDRFFTRFLFQIPPQQMTKRSTEFASKKKSNYNVMVIRFNHMTLAREQSYDFGT